MWNSFKCCIGTGESGYMGFADVYDNTIAFLLEEPRREKRDYYQLVESNREIFTRLHSIIEKKVKSHALAVISPEDENIKSNVPIKLVEPRALLHLLNYIETHDTRLQYAPRPFYRSNVFCLSSLLQMKDSLHMACLFCGQHSSFCIKGERVTSVAVRETDITECNMSVAEIGGTFFSNMLMPEVQTECRTPPSEECDKLHHRNCPVAWLRKDENAVWNYKNASFVVRGISKFHHMLQFITRYPRPRENSSWLCFINRMSSCPSPGASMNTLENLFRIIVIERLGFVAERLKTAKANNWVVYYSTTSEFFASNEPPLHYYRDPIHVNQYISEIVNLADDEVGFGDHRAMQTGEILRTGSLSFGGSHAVLAPARQQKVVTHANEIRPYTTAHRPFDQTPGLGGTLQAESVVGAFTDNTVTDLYYHRLLYLHGFLVQPLEINHHPFAIDPNTFVDRSESHVCLYCGVMFLNTLLYFQNAMKYYSPAHVDRLVKYAIAGANEGHTHRDVFGRHLQSVSVFQAIFPRDLTSSVLPHKVKADERLQKALVWLSASMDALHTDECVFRLKRRSFATERCCVCFTRGEVGDYVALSCGHELCKSCYNEISITDCCMCKRGYRSRHMTVSDSVVLGYLQGKVLGKM